MLNFKATWQSGQLEQTLKITAPDMADAIAQANEFAEFKVNWFGRPYRMTSIKEVAK